MTRDLKRALWVGAGVYLAFHAFAYVMAVQQGLGAAESKHDPASVWMYLRRLSMIAIALWLPRLAGGPLPREYGWALPSRWLAIAVGLGLLIGFGNRGGYELTSVALLLGAAFHAFATELYFRGYWLTLLERASSNRWLTAFGSGLLYGLSTLTWYATYHRELPPWGFILLFSSLGMTFAWSKQRSGSTMIAFVMHFVGVLNLKQLLAGH